PSFPNRVLHFGSFEFDHGVLRRSWVAWFRSIPELIARCLGHRFPLLFAVAAWLSSAFLFAYQCPSFLSGFSGALMSLCGASNVSVSRCLPGNWFKDQSSTDEKL